jgi:polyisoprenoid-binding protein YceI
MLCPRTALTARGRQLSTGKETNMLTRASIAVVVLLLGLLLAPVGRAADLYNLDPGHTSIVFGVGHANLSFVYGFFRRAQGSYIIDRTNPAACRFKFAVDVDSIDTNQADRDKHLLSEEFFDVRRFPRMTFDSTSCSRANTTDGSIVYNVTGDMTIHGVTRQVTLPMRLLAEGDGASKKDRRTAFLCQFELKRSDYGMNTVPLVGNAVGITISFEGIQQPEPTTARRTP